MTSDRFTAIPLGRGESFLLETHDENGKQKVILVDSGALKKKKSKSLAQEILKVNNNLKVIDIAVCTHSDTDHINGYTTFFDEWYGLGNKVNEFWVPAIWSFLDKSLKDPSKLAAQLVLGAENVFYELYEKNADQELTPSSVHEKLSQLLREKRDEYMKHRGQLFTEINEEKSSSDDKQSLSKLNDLEVMTPSPSKVIKNLKSFFSYSFYYPFLIGLKNHDKHAISFGILANSLFDKTIKHTATIVKVLEGADRHQMKIRWFDFDLFEQNKNASGGIKELLIPISAVEVGYPQNDTSPELLFLALKLDAINVGALVFYRPEINNCPSVLFCSDSRLSFGTNTPTGNFLKNLKKPNNPPIITAPHHGSSTNDYAYCLIKSWLGSELTPIFIRNGYHPKIKIKKFFDQTNRSCAICRIPGRSHEEIIKISSDCDSWKSIQSCSPCR